MAYQSEFTGAQMDAVFRRVTAMQLGTKTITATNDGLAYDYWDAEPGLTGAVVLGNVQQPGNTAGLVCLSVTYDSETGQMFARIMGDGVQDGATYTVHWLLIA